MAAQNNEETSKRKRFSLLQKDESFYRSNSRNNAPQDDMYHSSSNDSHTDEIYHLNDRKNSYERQTSGEMFYVDNDIPIVNYKEDAKSGNNTPTVLQRGRPKKTCDSLEWNDEVTEILIDLWKAKGELYDKAHPNFYQREMKDKAVEDIRDGLRSHGLKVTTNQILSKFQSLRTYFCSQRTKLTHSKKYGNVHDDGECKWRFFKSLHFLDDNMKIREGYAHKRRYDGETVQTTPYLRSMVFKEQNLPRDIRDESTLSPDSDCNSRQHENGIEKLEQRETCKSPEVRKDDQLFGELVGNMMHQLPQGHEKDLLKLEIQQLIIKAKYNSTSSDTN